MANFKSYFGVVALVALGACSQGGFMTNTDGLGAGPAAGSIVPGSPDDPTSLAYFQQTVGDRVLFEVDASTISTDGQIVLDGQAAWLTQNVEFTAVIEGHADEQGTREYNLALGARRANAVREYLVSRGVAPNRVRTVTFGKERPIEICSNESCYSQNRRAVTVLAAGGLS